MKTAHAMCRRLVTVTLTAGLFFVYAGSAHAERPRVSTLRATNVTSTQATINAHIDPRGTFDTQWWFEWGKTAALGNFTPRVSQTNSPQNIQYTLTNLTPGQTYFFRAVAQNSTGIQKGGSYSTIAVSTNTQNNSSNSNNTGSSNTNNQTNQNSQNYLLNLAISADNQRAISKPATRVTTTSAELNALAITSGDAYTEGWFEWGPTTALGFTTARRPIGAFESIEFSTLISELKPKTAYYYRAVIQNRNGTSRGDLLTLFTGTSSNLATPPNSLSPDGDSDSATGEKAASIKKDIYFIAGDEDKKGTAEFVVRVENTGSNELENVVVTETLPLDLSYESSIPEATYDDKTRSVRFNLGNIAEGDAVALRLTLAMQGDDEKSISHNATQVVSGEYVANSNSARVYFGGRPEALNIKVKTNPITIASEDTIRYEISYTNTTIETLEGGVVRIVLPRELTYVPSEEPLAQNGGVLEYNFGSLKQGEEGVIRFETQSSDFAKGTLEVTTTVIATFLDSEGTESHTIEFATHNVGARATNGASAFLGGSFLPNSILEWVLLFATVLLVIFLMGCVVRLFKREDNDEEDVVEFEDEDPEPTIKNAAGIEDTKNTQTKNKAEDDWKMLIPVPEPPSPQLNEKAVPKKENVPHNLPTGSVDGWPDDFKKERKQEKVHDPFEDSDPHSILYSEIEDISNPHQTPKSRYTPYNGEGNKTGNGHTMNHGFKFPR